MRAGDVAEVLWLAEYDGPVAGWAVCRCGSEHDGQDTPAGWR